MQDVTRPAAEMQEHVYRQAQRIASSAGLRGSEPLRALLLFLAERYREHPGEPVKEYAVATQVLGRNSSFDSRTDSSVRVTASRLRSKLAEYYVHEGAEDDVVLDIPKGSYVLAATIRTFAESAEAAPHAPQSRRPSPRRRWPVAAAIAIVAGLIGFSAGRLSMKTSPPDSLQQFWSHFAGGPGETLVVYSNPRLVGRPEDGMRLSRSPNSEKDSVDVYTGTGEVMAVRELTRVFDQLNIRARAKRALLFTWDEARANDLVFVGGEVQNQALGLLPRLEKLNFGASAGNPQFQGLVIRNGRPQAGEPAEWVPSHDLANGVEYAIVALTPGASRDRRVLILAGNNTHGTQAAAEFVCHPVRVGELLARLGVGSGRPLPAFEALLKLDVRGGAPAEGQLVLVHKRSDASFAAEKK